MKMQLLPKEWDTIVRVLEMQAADYSQRYELGKIELLNIAKKIKYTLDNQ